MLGSHKATIPSPWAEFLKELDALLTTEVRVHCIGGFVVSLHYGLPRPTGDVDYYSVLPEHCARDLQGLAGADSALAKKYRLHFQQVAVTNLPENYEDRLAEIFPGKFKKLRLFAPDPYDLILSKLERNSPKDRDDVEYMAKTLRLDPALLRERYQKELRPYLTNEARHDLTLSLWIESCFPPSP
jgi:Nucleotidyltransferase of unknown function (DUF6036)